MKPTDYCISSLEQWFDDELLFEADKKNRWTAFIDINELPVWAFVLRNSNGDEVACILFDKEPQLQFKHSNSGSQWSRRLTVEQAVQIRHSRCVIFFSG